MNTQSFSYGNFRQNRLLEIACFSQEGAQLAAASGAQRIELCSNYSSGGISPKPEVLINLKKSIVIPVFVMIRPRPGNFIYSNRELKEMEACLIRFKENGADGFVFGVLNKENELNQELCNHLIKLASPLPCTLHRAFDLIEDKPKAINQAIDSGFARILTSGGIGHVTENLPAMNEIVKLAATKIIIVAGGGLRHQNIHTLKAIEGLKELHSSAIIDEENEMPDAGEIRKILTFLN
jgi:copper homeostasis protein